MATDFDELIAHGKDCILEPEGFYARVAKSDLKAEYIVHVLGDRSELVRDERDLPESESHGQLSC